MSITITTDIFCDECSEWAHVSCGEKADRANARKEAKKLGWSVRRDGYMVCADCLRKNYQAAQEGE